VIARLNPGEVAQGGAAVKQIYPFIALAVLLAAGFFFAANFQVATDDAGGPQILPRDNTQTSGGLSLPSIFGGPATTPPERPSTPVSVPGRQAPTGGDVIRIASFNIQVFGESKLGKPEVVDVLANIVRNFDVVAVQEVRAQSQSVLPDFLTTVNAAGAQYDYVISERLGRTSSKEQYAYVFNTNTIEVDRRTLYTVSDPDDLLHREPFVAWFRCRNADPQQAFTFSMVNIHTDPDEVDVRKPDNELDVLDDVFRAVRDDGRGEDDVILVGDFNAGPANFGQLGRTPNLAFVIYGDMATNVRGNAQYDNIVFDQTATYEFLGRGGVFDFLREYNLSLTQAKQVSDHLPVWAEFSVYEGGVPGRVAARPSGYNPRSSQPSDDDARRSQVPEYDRRLPQPQSRTPRGNNAAPRYSNAPQYTADPRYPGDADYPQRYAPAPSSAQPRTSRPATRW